MDPTMQQQYYYAPGATAGAAPTAQYAPGYYQASAHGGAAGDSNGYVLPMQPHQQVVYYAAAPPGGCPAPGYAYAPAPMYYQPPEAAFAAMSLSGQTMLPLQQQQQQPQQTPGAASTASNGSSSQPRAASTPIPSEEPASLAAPTACNPSMIPMQVMYTQMPQYYGMAPNGYEGQPLQHAGSMQQLHQPMMPMMYQDPSTGQMMQQHPQHMQHQQQHINRMMSTDPDMIPPNLDDISQISHQSSPDSFIEHPGQRHPSTPVTSLRRRVSLPPTNQNGGHIPALMPSNYKTRMCTQWLEKRSCSMGTSCKFAHGNEELRLPERPFRAINNPKYKTKMCKNFEPGASGLCAYAERCEYIHPTDREFIAYKARIESLARSKGDYTRYKAMFDEVPGVAPVRRGRGAHSTTGGDDDRSVRSADSSCDAVEGAYGASSPAARSRRGSTRGVESGYLGSAMPPSMTRSAIRMGAGGDAPTMKRGFAGGSMYNLASGAYTERDEYRSRLTRVPSASNVASLGAGGAPRRYGGYGGASQPKFNRRASMCHLNTAEY
ncbi:hypothetical protein PFISCL1PPCAC_20670 [Pristionchus fissidentatus]|uniref:C3H1-type domain-containing protein n=1 Tax=Pristionchus fissidentatus TaxID=1538716 RepID=A0AAV5WCW8_9BILA|nr:hypothetical protein PFISCL1PPCAC_20670 [Pristionchus fissidentatus]